MPKKIQQKPTVDEIPYDQQFPDWKPAVGAYEHE
jgi:hypothetical protein